MVSPLTPRLTETSRKDLDSQLVAAGFPEVSLNSVALALCGALGATPHTNTYRYDEPYPQLPKVDVQATVASADSVTVELVASLSALRVRLAGRYRLLGNMVWQADEQVLRRD